ncbi:hypothetical protein VFPPC_18068 [Pochonia chlamydosporia 170]|uniref:Uncharacterized protein n=1 Tax=Pochonia chlamydosporia 170 TaxID=1380566 RepID=A0A179EY29_METCM|nr:hypothetical protein VFPPC_15027 [Pochonia chlamydosporia 170]XP_022285287.1 hypothetical protein VFPPC_18068 [Pochonia chlamydosporia 170]OAQ58052.2 hypothetical protein VFPPC_15027 [Pochonia chlamydosporia 170]OWT42813.1 hypothetical protein VFPPC_18068 [Pochonia chlamydosporia 170]
MSTPAPISNGSTNPRKPLDSQANTGSDMSMMFSIQTDCPSRFAYQHQHRIKGLNAETLARVFLPAPSWILAPEYARLRSDPENPSACIFFSLNLSLYNQQIVPAEWAEQWFFVSGRVHPYALTWEIEQQDGLEANTGAIAPYTIPALIVRDQGYQPILPRSLNSVDHFPAMPPVVAFTGPVLGSGHTLLRNEHILGLNDIQLKCCGFVQLSTFIAPGNPDKTPWKGFHPFQVFVIFPIHANPWASLCKKMVEKQDTHFQSNTLFTCTAKIAGLLDHNIMLHPPGFDRDYVFIVVPDTWTFLDRATSKSASATLSLSIPPKQPSSGPMAFGDAKAMFASPPKPTIYQSAPLPSTPPRLALVEPSTPLAKRKNSDYEKTPTKTRRLSPASSGTIPSSQTNDPTRSLMASASSQDELVESETGIPITCRPDAPTSDSITALLSDSPRPYRNRHPPKKYLEVE